MTETKLSSGGPILDGESRPGAPTPAGDSGADRSITGRSVLGQLEGRSAGTEPPSSVVTECDLPEAPEKVWKALTVPKLLAAWLPDAINSEILAAEPNRLLRYRWPGREEDRDERGQTLESVVTFELTGTESGGTHLRVVHRVVTSASSNVVAFRGRRREPFGMLSRHALGSGLLRAGRRKEPFGMLSLPARGSGLLRARCALASGSGEGEALRWAA